MKLSENEVRPNLRVKHLSRRVAWINFANPGNNPANYRRYNRGEIDPHTRGFFLDLKTLAAALTSKSHSLDSLAKFLEVPSKIPFQDFSRAIDAEFIGYALADTQATWRCYQELMRRFSEHGLTKALPHRIYSEASLGKAYLREMDVTPWRQTQPDFDPEIIGAIMSSYFGGSTRDASPSGNRPNAALRFRVHVPDGLHADGLVALRHRFGNGARRRDCGCPGLSRSDHVSDLARRETWSQLHVLVQVLPDTDIFPVRSRYGSEPIATIGLNYLSADQALWFTLADCMASKLLTGKSPKVTKAIRFRPLEPQAALRPIAISGNERYRVHPTHDDFYKRVIDLRRSVKARQKARKLEGADAAELKRLESEQLALKILANATSYGIFIELNVDDPDEVESPIQIHASAGSRVAKSAKRENPGDFFHPLLGTLITGAARLMLAITERLLLDEGLDWIFCDTDSMAFAGPAKIPLNEFEKRVRSVCGWFDALNPYEQPGSILEFEDQNFAIDLSRGKRLEPLYCAAISAKRYALFNFYYYGEPIIRKASAHGLGHLLSPYDDGPKSDERENGVRQWQEDLWKEIIKSLRSANPLEVRFDWRPELNHPAVSQYTAATPDLQARFPDFNRDNLICAAREAFQFLVGVLRQATRRNGAPGALEIFGRH